MSLEKQACEPRLLLGPFVGVVDGWVDPAASAVAGATTGALAGVELPARARKELPPRASCQPSQSPGAFAWCLSAHCFWVDALDWWLFWGSSREF